MPAPPPDELKVLVCSSSSTSVAEQICRDANGRPTAFSGRAARDADATDADDGKPRACQRFPAVKALDVAKQHDGAVIGGQLVDACSAPSADFSWRAGSSTLIEPVSDRRDVAAVRIELRKQLVQRDIGAAAATPPATLICRVATIR